MKQFLMVRQISCLIPFESGHLECKSNQIKSNWFIAQVSLQDSFLAKELATPMMMLYFILDILILEQTRQDYFLLVIKAEFRSSSLTSCLLPTAGRLVNQPNSEHQAANSHRQLAHGHSHRGRHGGDNG